MTGNQDKNMKEGASSLKKDAVVFSLFLLLSFGFWYLNSLRKEFETDIKYPVRYINPPAGMKTTGDLPERLTLNLKGPGYSIIKLRISGNRAPLIVDFSKVAYTKNPSSAPSGFFIWSGSLIVNFSKQLRSEFQIQSVKPDTIYFNFARNSAGEKSKR